MRSGLAMVLFSLGLVGLSFGAVLLLLGVLGGHYGYPHPSTAILTLGFMGVGALLVGGAYALTRSEKGRARS